MASPAFLWRLSTLSLVLLLSAALVSCGCSFSWDISCSADWEATVVLGFDDDGWNSASEYDAEVVFHWGVGEETSFGTRSYEAGNWTEETRSHRYEERGRYIAGASISYGEGAVCEGLTKEKCFDLTIHDGGCDVRKQEECSDPPPARPPANPPATAPATDPPISSPSAGPTTARPSDGPSTSPSARIGAPAAKAVSPAPSPPADAFEEDAVACTMALDRTGAMDEASIGNWAVVTETKIRDEAAILTGLDADLIAITLEFEGQGPLTHFSRKRTPESDGNTHMLEEAKGGAEGHARHSPGVEIDFAAIVRMPPDGEGPRLADIATSAFQTPEGRRAYVDSLKEADSHFDDAELIGVSINGVTVTTMYPSIDRVAEGADAEEGRRGGRGGGPHTLGLVAAGAAGGAGMLLCGMGLGVLCTKRKSHRGEEVREGGGDADAEHETATAATTHAASTRDPVTV